LQGFRSLSSWRPQCNVPCPALTSLLRHWPASAALHHHASTLPAPPAQPNLDPEGASSAQPNHKSSSQAWAFPAVACSTPSTSTTSSSHTCAFTGSIQTRLPYALPHPYIKPDGPYAHFVSSASSSSNYVRTFSGSACSSSNAPAPNANSKTSLGGSAEARMPGSGDATTAVVHVVGTKPAKSTYGWARAHFIGGGQPIDLEELKKAHAGIVQFDAGGRDFLVLNSRALAYKSKEAHRRQASKNLTAEDFDDEEAVFEKVQLSDDTVVIFSFGSVVYFTDRHLGDSDGEAVQENLEESGNRELTKFVVGRPALQAPAPEKVQLAIIPTMKDVYRKGPDYLQLQCWDRGNLETLSRIMGQSVALDHYHSVVDTDMDTWERVITHKAQVSRQGGWQRLRYSMTLQYSALKRLALGARGRGEGPIAGVEAQTGFQPSRHEEIAATANNARLLSAKLMDLSAAKIKIIGSLGILDKGHTPWQSDDHDMVWQGLTEYYSVDSRVSHLFKKLDCITKSVDHMQNTRTSENSVRMELTIIVLIAVEIVQHAWDKWT